MKYMGSKARFTKEILPIILKERKPEQWYIEPFAGGMNAICEVQGNRIANDIHYPLIQMWRELVDGWMPKKITKEEYIEVRTNQSKYPAYFVGWVGFNCSYSGKWFGGFADDYFDKGKNYKINGERNVLRNYQMEAINAIQKQVKKMKGVILQNKHYFELELPPNSIIYCDPPYQYTTKYANDFDHTIFWNWVRNISKQGHTVFVSEYNAPNDFKCVWEKNTTSQLAINNKIGKSKVATERLFLYCN
jgi:DNA adenine methylase